eukprot:SAG11_NODE_29297_length_312_cov_0.971831_1_plen_34_part_10
MRCSDAEDKEALYTFAPWCLYPKDLTLCLKLHNV